MVFDLFHESIQDNLDLFGHLAMEAEGEEQLKYSKHFQKFYELLPKEGQLEYGRVHTRLCMLRVTFRLAFGLLLLDPKVDKDRLAEEFGAVKSLNEWPRDDWKQCKESLINFLEIILEKGAVVGINEPDDETLVTERVESPKYNIDRITRALDMCAILAPLRCALNNRSTPKTHCNILADIRKEAKELENQKISKLLRALVVEDETNGDLKMKDMDEVRRILERDELSVKRTATKTLEKLKSWNKDLFQRPKLYPFHFDDSDDESSEEEEEEEEESDEESEATNTAAERRKSAGPILVKGSSPRATLSTNMVHISATHRIDDDKEGQDDRERRPINPDETGSPPKSSSKKRKRQGDGLLQKKKSATQIRFDDSDDEENLDPAEVFIGGSPVRAPTFRRICGVYKPPKQKRAKSQQKSYEGKRKWTDAEKDAVIEGVYKLGAGHWAKIKDMYPIVLKDRTSGQIKDKYRQLKNMMKRADQEKRQTLHRLV